MPKRLTGGLLDFFDQYPDGVAPDGVLILCGSCATRREPSEFYIRSGVRARDEGKRIVGNLARCRDCAREHAQAYKASRVAILHAAKASGCVDCGLIDLEHPEIFDLDHVRGEKVANIAALVLRPEEELRAELAKCEVVCANCHRIRTQTRGPVARGWDVRRAASTVDEDRKVS